jgi:DNA-directed RNA polymerase subunit RPC12/RpoP
MSSLDAEEPYREPYICLGCQKVFRHCPDFDKFHCPACGDIVMPKKRWNARERIHGRFLACDDGCDCDVDRASGDVVCPACNEIYYEHPRCKQSAYDGGGRLPHYAAHVICDGRHVHL